MRNIYIFLILTLALSACGGAGSGGTPPPVPNGLVSGTAFDSLISDGTVSIYDFSAGSKGALLAQSKTDTSGRYSVSLPVESRPILIEVTSGYYTEEASGIQVALNSNHKLTSLTNYTTGTQLKVVVTTYTHLAAGLAIYKIKNGTSIATAINDANTLISSITGINIITTTPLLITDVRNLSAAFTPELKYGFLAGAISMWTNNNGPAGLTKHSAQYTSIDFAQTMYTDIVTDGVLDGFAPDSVGNQSQLSFGAVPLNPSVYRLGLGTAIVQMAGNSNNRTGLTGAQVLSYAQTYIASENAIFNNVSPVSFSASTSAIMSPATYSWARRVASISPSVLTPFGIKTVEFYVDGTLVATNTTSNPLLLNTAHYADGEHTIEMRTTDLGGFVRTDSIKLKVDNTPPQITSAKHPCAYSCAVVNGTVYSNFNGTATDNYSGAYSVSSNGYDAVVNGYVLTGYVVNGVWSYIGSVPGSIGGTGTDSFYKARVKDTAGNCSDYEFVGSTLTLLTYNSCS